MGARCSSERGPSDPMHPTQLLSIDSCCVTSNEAKRCSAINPSRSRIESCSSVPLSNSSFRGSDQSSPSRITSTCFPLDGEAMCHRRSMRPGSTARICWSSRWRTPAVSRDFHGRRVHHAEVVVRCSTNSHDTDPSACSAADGVQVVELVGKELVGMAGFEPAAPRPPVWCASQAALHPERSNPRNAEDLRICGFYYDERFRRAGAAFPRAGLVRLAALRCTAVERDATARSSRPPFPDSRSSNDCRPRLIAVSRSRAF